MARARVAILGGGLAGLSAALRLGHSDYDVELFEKRPALGGRASSFVPPGETAAIDNCQHVLLGCCTNLLDFFRRAGVADRFRFYNRYVFAGPTDAATLGAASLPAPLHLLPSLLSFQGLEWRDRWAVASAMWAILRTPPPLPDEPLLAWLERHRQSPAARDNFWRVILTSALNEELERLSTRPAFHVFLDAFLRNRRGYRMGVPTVPLSELYSGRMLAEKCVLRLATPVMALAVADGRVQRLRLQDGEEKEADYFLSALPCDALSNLLSGEQRSLWPAMQQWTPFEWSPITGIHLWFDRQVMDTGHLTVFGRTIQWVFNKSAIVSDNASGASLQYIQLVVSASRSLMTLRREEILELALRELAEILPKSKGAQLEKAVVVKETKATLSFPPGLDAQRPGPETPFSNLFLAGDWTATGWPPTMESAVRSGYRAAERITEAAGNPEKFLATDLPVDPLAGFLQRS